MESASPDKTSNDALTRLAGGSIAILALLGGGAITGVLARLARDEHVELSIAIIAGLGGAMLWARAAQEKRPRVKQRLLFMASFFALAAVVTLIGAVVGNASIRGRPSIDATLSGGASPQLHGSVSAEGMKTSATLNVYATAYSVDDPTRHIVLYAAAIGPDAEGEAHVAFSVSFKAAAYSLVSVGASVDTAPECFADAYGLHLLRVQTGCVALRVAIP